MSPVALLGTVVGSLSGNKLRTALTLLGIVIGVAAVIALMSIGRGAQRAVTANIESLGTNLLFVQPAGGFGRPSGPGSALTLEDAYALLDPVYAPSVLAVAPEIRTSGQVTAGRNNTWTQIIGVTPDYEAVRNFPAGSGSFITQGHVDSRAEVAVLGTQVAETLFGLRDPVGQAVRINGRQFLVIGVLKSKGGTPQASIDHQLLVPTTTAYYRLGVPRTARGDVAVQSINVQARSSSTINSARDEITMLLRLRHRVTGEDDFVVNTQRDTIDALESTTGIFVVFLGSIASISLLVGGIGIMNIMLVSVTERTREIGVRKAMGARKRDILLQFSSEATLISLCGGLVGVTLGLGIAAILGGMNIGLGPGSSAEIPVSFSPDIAVLALVVSAGIGLFFGIYPAVRAARLHPIEALRYQ